MPLLLLILYGWLLGPGLTAADGRLIRAGSLWRFYKGTNEPSQTLGSWRFEGFDDRGWTESMSGFSTTAYAPEPGYLPDYGYLYRTLYLRKTFAVTDPAALAELTFRVDYDDGFVAYLNGQEIARRGIAGPPNVPLPVNTFATYHPRGPTEEINITDALPLLRGGTNLLAIQVFGWGTNDYTVAFVPELAANFTRGPYIQNTTSNSTQIIFKTLSPAPAFVEVKTNDAASVRLDLPPGTNHVATLTGLQPDASYDYRIGADLHGREVLSDWHSFRTFKPAGGINFQVLGDSGWGSAAQHGIAGQMRNAETDLIMHVGDLVYYAFTHSAEDFRCLSVYADEMFRTPMFLALGNHEKYANINDVLETFYLPTNNVTGTEHYYSFDHGDVHFTVVWSDLEAAYSDYSPGSRQYQWLENDLRTTSKPWKFLFFHHVWRSSGPHSFDDYDLNGTKDSVQLEQGPVALAQKYGVQVIFNGHDHDYERFTPRGGVLSVVTGGGGAALYSPWQMHGDSVQYYLKNEFLKIAVDGEQTLIQAVGLNGEVFDQIHLRRSLPERKTVATRWNTPQIDRTAPGDLDGNISGQSFDFAGDPIGGKVGQYSSTGRLFLNSDHRNLYIGLDEVMLHAGDELFLFLETPGVTGITNMASLATAPGITNSLQTLGGLAFTQFAPGIGLVLGDEYGDGGFTNFVRAGSSNNTGQGAFFLTADLPLVPGQKITQFNRSPEGPAVSYEQNADFIKIALPYASIGAKPSDHIKIGAIVGLRASGAPRTLDSGIGYSVTGNDAVVLLEPVEFEIGADQDLDGDGLTFEQELALGTDPNNPDTDGDGMPDGWEVANGLDALHADGLEDADGDGMSNWAEFVAGTDPRDAASRLIVTALNLGGKVTLRWTAIPNKLYQVQARSTVEEGYRDLADASLPRRATQAWETYAITISPGNHEQYYRITVLQP